ncbi:MAG: hypothetical protein WKG07_14630 [Hymenobacter sp.]
MERTFGDHLNPDDDPTTLYDNFQLSRTLLDAVAWFEQHDPGQLATRAWPWTTYLADAGQAPPSTTKPSTRASAPAPALADYLNLVPGPAGVALRPADQLPALPVPRRGSVPRHQGNGVYRGHYAGGGHGHLSAGLRPGGGRRAALAHPRLAADAALRHLPTPGRLLRPGLLANAERPPPPPPRPPPTPPSR